MILNSNLTIAEHVAYFSVFLEHKLPVYIQQYIYLASIVRSAGFGTEDEAKSASCDRNKILPSDLSPHEQNFRRFSDNIIFI
jgi:hypothetical protein